MSYRKAAVVLAAAFVLLCIPRAGSLADASHSTLTSPQTKAAYASKEDGQETEATVSLQDGDTVLFNNQDAIIGTLQVDSTNGTILFFADQSAEGKTARVLYDVPSDTSEQWLRYSTGTDDAPAYLLLVSVRIGDENISTKGWINVASVLNFAQIASELDNAPLLDEIKTLKEEVDKAAQTPAPTPLPTATPQSKIKSIKIVDQLLDNLIAIALLVAILALLICVLIVLTGIKRKEEIRHSRENERRKRDIKECLDESLLPSIDQTVRAMAKKMEDQSGDYQYMQTTVREIGRKLAEPEKRPMKDWEELAEIANSAMTESSYENWKQLFAAKGWVPQAVQATALNIPGEFEIAEFGMAHSFAAFAAHDPEFKERLYVIPSITDRDLRSRQIVDLFDIRREKTADSEPYRIMRPAVLYSTDGRFYKTHSKGEIQIQFRE